jgi:SH3 domain-containing YSC84-like protein 1
MRLIPLLRRIGVAACCTLLSVSAARADMTQAERQRVKDAAAVLQTRADAIPRDTATQAACVMIFPSVKKAAFIVGGEYGRGLMTCRNGDRWTAPVFTQLEKGSFGLQAGAEEIDLVLLVMNRRGAERLLRDKVTLGAGMSIAAGPVGSSASAATDAQLKAEILSYSRSRGAFAGADISGGVLGPDGDANRDVYGASVTPQEVIAEHSTIKPPPEAQDLLTAVQRQFGVVRSSARR